MALDIIFVVGGGLVLYLGAEWLVKGSAGLAHAFGVRPLVIGLTVVAYGTSAPELAVSAAAMVNGSSDIVIGNIVGSCIANLGLILGVTALISPPSVDGRLIKREIPVLVASVIAVPLTLYDGAIVGWEAGLLLACAIAFTVVTLTSASRKDPNEIELPDEVPEEQEKVSKVKLSLLTAVGLAALLGGGEFFVRGAVGVAAALGMSEKLVGLTIVAIGTSLPELAASVVAALRGFSGLAVGNVIGSNIFNVFLVLGVVGLIHPVEAPLSTVRLDLLFLAGITVVGVLTMRGNRLITRAEGILLLGAYGSFIVLAIIRG